MNRRRWALGLGIGLAGAVGLVVWHGAGEVARALASGGWGILWVVPFWLLPLVLATEAWRVLFPNGRRIGFPFALHGSWVGFGVNWLLPVAMVGGEAAKVRLMQRRGMDAGLGAATVVADKTIQVGTQAAFAVVGLGLLGARYAGGEMVLPASVAIVLLALGTYAFFRVQMRGLFSGLAGLVERLLPGSAGGDGRAVAPEEVDRAIRAIYGDAARWLGSSLWRMAFRVVWAGEVWLALRLLGDPVGVVEAVIIESLGQAGRAAGFLIPGGLGAQEGAILAAGAAVGVGPDTALALALVKRVRELGVGLPALLAWQLEEGWAALRG